MMVGWTVGGGARGRDLSPRRGPIIHRKGETVKIRLQQITPSPNGLCMGVQIHGPRDSWVRFGLLEVPWSEVPQSVIDAWWAYQDRDERVPCEDTPLALDWS